MLGTDMMLFQYKQMAAGSTVNNLNKELVGNTVVKYPSPAEQSKIGVYFSTLDGIITLHKKKCDELRNIKKFMLQNMFIQKKYSHHIMIRTKIDKFDVKYVFVKT